MAASTTSFPSGSTGGPSGGSVARMKSALESNDHNNNLDYASGKLANSYRIDNSTAEYRTNDDYRVNRTIPGSDLSRNPNADYRGVPGYNTDYRLPLRAADFRVPTAPSNSNGRSSTAEYSSTPSRAAASAGTQEYPSHFWNYSSGGKR